MDTATWMMLLGGAPAATGLAALHLMGSNNRAKVANDLKAAPGAIRRKAEQKVANQKVGSIKSVSNLDGTSSIVNEERAVVDLRHEIERIEALERKINGNPNRKTIDDFPFDDRPENPDGR